MDKMNFDIFGCDHVGMVCKDIKASKKFYTEVLGMTCIYEADVPCPSGIITTCFVKRGNLIIDLEQFPEDQHADYNGVIGHIAFQVSDFDAAKKYLLEQGCKFDNENDAWAPDVYNCGVRFNFFRGPDNEMLELFWVNTDGSYKG
ncbi:MAG TPA: VOC family protein [Candidatus Pullichristensenella stercorigallinarum]|uniref:VOC family protein n=1 Tax=Candidatus Pullichristensenella stercorigallinarum TaxID=2840909 RepID=A0A9D0ZKT7_9FIRM|nr:VOC family protein [Candidatus Pullichristensenella stercorigallinarum]